MASSASSSTHGVLQVEHATALPEADRARALLDDVRRHAEPVLRARGWRVRRLAELCCCKAAPESGKSANVAGWCLPAGDGQTAQTIALRLRKPKGGGHGLLPFESLFETMLHEMAHIVHSRHSPAFFELMDELRVEWEGLLAKGHVLDAAGFPLIGGSRMTFAAHNPTSTEQGRTL
eukprot:CAMPEP_0183526546 /NCGR_PEP_ID=MMETSP0371-20130417/21399_1 /TAXON_ID=268820 /ORGANISM="Peridinium aciculiferum, Strain PAER-2" /LENGTH=176 /DNA_ID=CAMNT_0025725915 /DNA_START=64 /DNA_END=590 /DNA_ORIENTATION=-